MYSTREIILLGESSTHQLMWNDQIACLKVRGREINARWETIAVSAFSFILVRQGKMVLEYDGQRIELLPNDVHAYAPGMPTRSLEVSEDYEGYCCIIDEELLHQTPLMNDFLRMVYFPIAELGKPKLSLSKEQSALLTDALELLYRHVQIPSSYQKEILLSLCKVIGYQLLHFQDMLIEEHYVPTRSEELFHRFLALVHEHYLSERSLVFYAGKLFITPIYLSRVVKQCSGRTAMDFINHALAAEAARRLKTSSESIGNIAFALRFSDQAAFSKFFARIKGMSPLRFRQQSRAEHSALEDGGNA